MRKMKKLPKFSSEEHEFDFWSKHDSTKYVDYSKGERMIFQNLKPSIKTISIRLPQSLIEYLKVLAHKRDVPYQSLMKMFLAERIKKELHLVEV